MFSSTQAIRQLEKHRGGYYYLEVPAEIVAEFPKQGATRLVCSIGDQLSYSCGLNHLGDGNFFIILATKKLAKLGKELGDQISFTLTEDPDPLGVAIPESLEVLLAQDPEAHKRFEQLTDGKKRSLIYAIQRIRDIDLQVKRTLEILADGGVRRNRER